MLETSVAMAKRPQAPHDMASEIPYMQPVQQFYNEEAQRISDLIDEELKREQIARKDAERKTIKVMLLGQAESGKSTLQKQFQLYHASHRLEHERPSWKPVVHFNVIKAVRVILDELDYDVSRTESEGPVASSSSVGASSSSVPYDQHAFEMQEISLLREKLMPLVALEASLASELNGGVTLSGAGGKGAGVYVRSGWQTLLKNRSVPEKHAQSTQVVAHLAARTLRQFRDDVQRLWKHPAVKRLHKLRLEESAPFFLNNIRRIAEPDYIPDTDDILNVRLQTLGVTEHSYPINTGGTVYDWRLYDVGGARGQRAAWIPYFDDATAIIFLAPISAFDQYLEEDFRTNRIDDSLQLWTHIVSNPLLKKAHLVLLLNKSDLLKKKLDQGIKIRKYITSYGNRPNRYEDASQYFRTHFVQAHKKKDTFGRPLFSHFTKMLDIQDTQRIIANVGEAIMHSHMTQTGLV